MKKNISRILITLSFIVSMNPYALIITIPIFIISVIIYWTTKVSFINKTIWMILPIILWYPALKLFMFFTGYIGVATAQKLDFNFKNNFEGSVIVMSNMPCGQAIKVIDKREQLYIPDNGIFLYQGNIKEGYVNHRYFEINTSGERYQLPERDNYMYFNSEINPPPRDIKGVWLRGTGTMTSNIPEPKIVYSFMTLTVSSKDSIEKFSEFDYRKKFENDANSLMRECQKLKNFKKTME